MKWLAVIPVATLAVVCGTFYAPPSAEAVATASACGRISVFDAAPRGKQLYPAVLIAVDGELPGPSDSPSFRVAPGKHVLTVAENIDSEQFSSVNQFQRSRAGRDRYQTLEVDVQPGVTYRLAAQFELDRRASINDNSYWSPVIWSEISESCR